MIEGYKNKMVDVYGHKLKEVVKYVGDIEVYIPDLKKIVKCGDIVDGFPIEEAKSRNDFTVIQIKGD
jgi:hypothetical protein